MLRLPGHTLPMLYTGNAPLCRVIRYKVYNHGLNFFGPGLRSLMKLRWRRTLVQFIFMQQMYQSPIYPLPGTVLLHRFGEKVNALLTTHHSRFTIHVSPFTIHQSSILIPHSSFLIPHSSFTIHHSPFTIHQSSFLIHHSPFTIHHSPFIIHHSPFTIHHSSFIIHHSSFIIQ